MEKLYNANARKRLAAGGGNRPGGRCRGEGRDHSPGRSAGLTGGALMVAGPQAAAGGPGVPAMWVAVGPDMRALPVMHTLPMAGGGQNGDNAHPRLAEAVRI